MFNKARWKLTLWYTGLIMLISASFSMVVYQIQTRELDRFIRQQQVWAERRVPGAGTRVIFFPEPDPELLQEVRGRILSALGMINLGILLLAAGSGYVLAGRTLQPIKEMVDEQNRFIGDASHELRTPLTSLKSGMEVFLRDKTASLREARNLISESLTDINKMQSLSDALLQLAQFKKPERKIRKSEVNLKEVIENVVVKMSQIALKKKIEIKADLQEMKIIGNEFELPDVFIILLDNAIKYSRSGSKIQLSGENKKSNAIIKVSDSGIGISKKDMPHIFERFYRADTARTKSDAGGYGLGLAIAKKIVDEHGGKIEVRSQTDKGTTVTVILPKS